MSSDIELERTYLLKFLPSDLNNHPYKELIDIYVPKSSHHPTLRIRKNGEKLEITKKEPISQADRSVQSEHTIKLTEAEFQSLSAAEGKRLHKKRYAYNYNGKLAELDVFQDALHGLVMIDFEFKTEAEKAAFQMPDFCLAEVTDENFLAGGMLCGKSYADIENELKRFNYKKID